MTAWQRLASRKSTPAARDGATFFRQPTSLRRQRLSGGRDLARASLVQEAERIFDAEVIGPAIAAPPGLAQVVAL